jgi:DNA-binding FadR family transcriptional regulator
MHKALQAMYQCESSRQGFTKADLAFHQAILEASGNPFLQSIGSVIGAALATSFTISSPVSSDARFREVMRQHQAVFDAIERGSPVAASEAMSELILQAAERVQIKQVESSLATVQIHAFSGVE